jgi:hypothetical protein
MNTPAMADDILHPASGEEPIDIEELLERSGLQIEEVRELVEVGVLEECATAPWLILVLRPLITGRWAARVRNDFVLHRPAMVLPRLRRFEAAPFQCPSPPDKPEQSSLLTP